MFDDETTRKILHEDVYNSGDNHYRRSNTLNEKLGFLATGMAWLMMIVGSLMLLSMWF